MDDDEMLAVLRRALAVEPGDGPPPRAVDAALAAARWVGSVDRMAVLVSDSADDPVPAGVRGAADAPRQLSYGLDDLTLDCELVGPALVGQAVPAAGLTLELVTPDGPARPIEVGPDGRFLITPAPAGPVGIRCLRPGRPPAMTPWLLA